jgi:dephospho-CoA kinase
MLKVGLTGGIGCGKSTVSDIFSSLDVPVIDSDVIAREVVAPGEEGLTKIVARFGKKVLNPDGTLNRKQLRTTIFDDAEARSNLESILHPLIRKRSNEQLAKLNSSYAILSIPLLVENGLVDSVDHVLVVDCSEQTQIKRICARDSVTQDRAEAILAAQCSRDQRLEVADDIIDNEQSLAELTAKVESLHQKYLLLSQKL